VSPNPVTESCRSPQPPPYRSSSGDEQHSGQIAQDAFDGVEQRGEGGDLVALGVDGDTGQNGAGTGVQRGQQVDLTAVAAGATQRFSIDGDNRVVVVRTYREYRGAGMQPGGESGGEQAVVEAGQQPPDSAAHRHAAGETEPDLCVFVEVMQPVGDRHRRRRSWAARRRGGPASAVTDEPRRLVAFLSHKYRSSEANLALYGTLLQAADIRFEVDEGLPETSITRLARMIRRADCFIGTRPGLRRRPVPAGRPGSPARAGDPVQRAGLGRRGAGASSVVACWVSVTPWLINLAASANR
jgi:hypothetical protein